MSAWVCVRTRDQRPSVFVDVNSWGSRFKTALSACLFCPCLSAGLPVCFPDRLSAGTKVSQGWIILVVFQQLSAFSLHYVSLALKPWRYIRQGCVCVCVHVKTRTKLILTLILQVLSWGHKHWILNRRSLESLWGQNQERRLEWASFHFNKKLRCHPVSSVVHPLSHCSLWGAGKSERVIR